jgi:hypothetical protein
LSVRVATGLRELLLLLLLRDNLFDTEQVGTVFRILLHEVPSLERGFLLKELLLLRLLLQCLILLRLRDIKLR